ncbi:MAG: glycosyltransferase family 1 protein [Parcubacteria group bacterium]|jgi:glycosyltransferase involved in cell wall biosynthesis
MRIGINASFARKPTNGTGQVTINFLKELTRICDQRSTIHDLEFVLYLEEDLPRGFKLPSNFSKNIFLPLWKRDDLIRKIWWEKYLLPKKVRLDKCDMFFSLYQSATILHPVGIRSLYRDRIPTNSIPHIMLVHDIIPKLFPHYLDNSRKRKYWQSTELAIAQADKILANSKRTEKDLVQQLHINPAKIVVNYLDVDEIYKKPVETHRNASVLKKYKLKPGYILAGGGMEIRKNVEGVIHAYKYLLEKNKTLHFIHELPPLVIYGKLLPQLAPLIIDAEKLVKELDLTAHVRLLNMTPQADMPALFHSAALFVYPSHYEGFGMPPLEAMNQGTPTIISKTSSLPEVGGDSVLYCNPDDHRDIAMVMRNVLINKNLHETLAKRGRERAQIFSWTKFTKKFLHVVGNIQ